MTTGPEAKAAFDLAARLVKEREYDMALKVLLLPSDRAVIERRIKDSRAASANKGETE